MMGYIMKKRQMAMGMETTGAPFTVMAMPSRAWARPGASLPRAIPPMMQSPTQSVRWRSKRFMDLLSLLMRGRGGNGALFVAGLELVEAAEEVREAGFSK